MYRFPLAINDALLSSVQSPTCTAYRGKKKVHPLRRSIFHQAAESSFHELLRTPYLYIESWGDDGAP